MNGCAVVDELSEDMHLRFAECPRVLVGHVERYRIDAGRRVQLGTFRRQRRYEIADVLHRRQLVDRELASKFTLERNDEADVVERVPLGDLRGVELLDDDEVRPEDLLEDRLHATQDLRSRAQAGLSTMQI